MVVRKVKNLSLWTFYLGVFLFINLLCLAALSTVVNFQDLDLFKKGFVIIAFSINFCLLMIFLRLILYCCHFCTTSLKTTVFAFSGVMGCVCCGFLAYYIPAFGVFSWCL